MSLCDTCRSPGVCCRSITLIGGEGQGYERFRLGMTEEEAAHLCVAYGFPFVPYTTDAEGYVLFTCPELDDDGRCKIYENRPSPCRNFEPGSSPLCVHYVPPESDDAPA
jgi:Fe-S-cluster containining protein